ncbi:IS4 family transposase, partial [Muribaculaceae bacterium Isolate-083 (Janvier)]
DKTHIRDLFDKKNINDVKVLYGSSEPNLFNF